MNEKQQALFKLGRELAGNATEEGWSVLAPASATAKNQLAQAFGILCLCANSPADAQAIITAAQSVRTVTGLDVMHDLWLHLGDTWPEIYEGEQ